MEQADLAIVAMGPLLTAMAAGIGVLIKEWRVQRRWEVRQRTILEVGLQEVTFIGQWSTTYASVSADDPQRDVRIARALADLERAYRGVEEGLISVRDERPERWDLASFLRVLALRGLHRRGAKVIRAFYYVGVVWILFASIIMMAVDSEAGWVYRVAVTVAVTLVYSLPVWGLYRWAVWLERSSLRKYEAPHPVWT